MNNEHDILAETLDGARPASEINPPGTKKSIELDKVLGQLEDIFQGDSNFKCGLSKSIKPKFNLVSYLKDNTRIIHDYISTNNKQLTSEQKLFIKLYFDSILKLYDVLKSVDLKVAEIDLICYIIGYNINITTSRSIYF